MKMSAQKKNIFGQHAMTLGRVKQLPVEDLGSPNPFAINFNIADFGNFGPNFRSFN